MTFEPLAHGPEGMTTRDPLVAFLYILMAEEVPYNIVAKIIDRVGWMSHAEVVAWLDRPEAGSADFRMTSGWLAGAAEEAATSLRLPVSVAVEVTGLDPKQATTMVERP